MVKTFVLGHAIHGVGYDFPHLCPVEMCAIARWLLARHTQTNMRTYERRSPDGDGPTQVADVNTCEPLPRALGTLGEPCKPREAGSEPADAQPLKTWPELVAEALT